MTELNKESGLPEGAPDANQDASPGTGTPTSVDVEALAKALGPTLEALVDRRFQSGKDKRIAKLEGKQVDFESQLARLEELQGEGFTKKAAIRMMKMEQSQPDEPPEQFDGTATPQGKAGSQPQASSANYADSLIAALGLPTNDAEVLRARDAGDPYTVVAQLTDLANKRRQSPPVAPNPASVMPSTGGSSVPAPDDLNSITARLSELSRNPTKNIDEIRKLSAKQRELLPKQ